MPEIEVGKQIASQLFLKQNNFLKVLIFKYLSL